MIKERISIKTFLLAFLLLYIIYEPCFSSLILGIHPYIFNVLFYGMIIFIYFIRHQKVFRGLFGEFRVFKFVIAIFIYGFYTLIITGFLGENVRFFQHIYVIVQVLILYVLNDYIKQKACNPDAFRLYILKLVVIIEFISCVLMIVSPEIKNLGVALYYAESSAEVNQFIISKRIFGLFGDYTFKCQIFNGMLSFFFIFFSLIEKRKDGYLFALMALFISIMNGRTGTLIFVVQILCVIILFSFIYPNAIQKTLKIIMFTSIGAIVVVLTISIVSPETYSFLMNMVLSLLGDESSTDQTINVLLNAISWPTGWGLIFGTGEVYYGSASAADIGFCNDVILVGVPMTILLYSTVFSFLFVRSKKRNNLVLIYNICTLLGLLIANFKGICLRNSTIVIGCLWLRMILEGKFNSVDNFIKSNERYKGD